MLLRTLVVPDRYLDSVFLMGLAGKLKKLADVADASAVMGTEANKGLLRETGLLDAQADAARPGDLIISLRLEQEAALQPVREAIRSHLDDLTRPSAPGGADFGGEGAPPPTTLEQAQQRRPDASLAVISLPGSYVRREAMRALELGLHPFIFSDNVSVADELALKERGRELGLLVMGPDCGTAILNGVAFGFANCVGRGPVGIVGASGTGIQELTCLLDRRGIGTHQAIGVGGRDLSQAIGGSSMLQAIDILEHDPACQVIVLVSKPPHPGVAERVLDRAAACQVPCIVCFLGGDADAARSRGLAFAPRLDLTARMVEALLDGIDPRQVVDLPLDPALQAEAGRLAANLAPGRRHLRALYSGGTLCEEALLAVREPLGSYCTNLEASGPHALGESDRCADHLFLDLGDDRYTRGRPHPMIDFTLRGERLLLEAADPDAAVILLDVVLGHGAHPDPAGALDDFLARLPEGGPVLVASVVGTEQDPQPYGAQRRRLEQAGVHVLDSNVEAARFAAAIVDAVAANKEQR